MDDPDNEQNHAMWTIRDVKITYCHEIYAAKGEPRGPVRGDLNRLRDALRHPQATQEIIDLATRDAANELELFLKGNNRGTLCTKCWQRWNPLANVNTDELQYRSFNEVPTERGRDLILKILLTGASGQVCRAITSRHFR
jgi:hypothetical protein